MNHIYHLHESCFYLVRKRYRQFSIGVEQTETCACALLFFLLRIPYFPSRRSVAQTGTDIFMCGFQLVTCKQEHVYLVTYVSAIIGCCCRCHLMQHIEFSRRRHVHVLLHLFTFTFPHAAPVCQQARQQNTTSNTFRGSTTVTC